MRDDDKLRFARDAAHVIGHAHHVRLVERRLDLIHDAERRRMNLQDGEVQRDGDERLFAAREQRDGLERLARRLDLDLDAAGEHIVFVLQLERRFAAAEELQKCLLKALSDEGELFFEDTRHLACDALDHADELALCLFHIVALGREVGVARIHALEFLDRADIHRAKAADGPLELTDAAARLLHAFQLDALLLRGGVRQLVVLPEPVEDLLFLHGARRALLLKLADAALDVEHVFVGRQRISQENGQL